MTFARNVYTFAGTAGLLGLLPMSFMAGRIGHARPPAITHPEYYYGFLGVAVAWQLAFLLIARDPARFRPLMPITALEKASFGLPSVVLYAQGRLAREMFLVSLFDLALGVLFLVA